MLPLREQRKRGLGENHQSPDQIPLNQQAGKRPAKGRRIANSPPTQQYSRLNNMLVAIGIKVALRVADARRPDFDPLFAVFRIISEFAP